MNRLVSLSILYFIALANTSVAQLPVLIKEEFNDNSNDWPIEESQKYDCAIKDGFYAIKEKSRDGTTFVCVPSSFDPDKDFEIEAKITFKAGSTYGFGLCTKDVRYTKITNEHYFTISQSGYFRLNTYLTDKGDIIHQEWKTDPSVLQGTDQTNILSIKQTGNKTSFFINGKEVSTLSGISYWGSEVGFVVYDTISVLIDYITIKQKHDAINVLPNATVLKKENLGPNVNSKIQDVTPVISHDGKTLYFSVRSDEADANNNYNSEIFYSELNKDGTWNKRKNIGYPLNNDQSNFIISATPDNNTVMLSGRYNKDGTSNGEGFSISHRERNGWSIPENIIVDDYYNNAEFVSYSFSADRKALLLSIERKDTYGRADLYVSFQKADETWTSPKNLGATINTFGKEETPFLAADGKTLYFSSNGHPGYGSSDIFMSRRTNDSWTSWTKPVNLGSQINTKEWDAYYTIPASGEYAYLASGENSLGEADIFRIKVAESAKPEPVVIIHGKVLDKITKQPLGATIDYHELSTGKDAGSARSNPADGTYKIVLPYGKAYGFLAEKTDFLSESDNIDLTTVKEYIEIERDLYLSPIEIGKSITLKNVFFVRSKSELLPDSFAELDRLIKILKDNPELKIEISGHTDNVGDPALNTKLSEERVLAIKNYLISKSISAKRLSGKGYGGSKPVASNATEETRKLNRRVEFVIIGK
ncbi:MAG: yiaD [Cytophagaceae bacterium]|jgi:outer membrane protein OmpA-like peptidoglycan-associated protein|nr:yiaD [Cytophagaceae bacterium]